MQPHRFRNLTAAWRLPRPPEPRATPKGFMVCPPALLQRGRDRQELWQQVYRLAFEQAQAVVRPSLPERDLLGNWN
jgi:hypothetical protein